MGGEILLVCPEWKLETNGDDAREKEYSSPETQKIQTKRSNKYGKCNRQDYTKATLKSSRFLQELNSWPEDEAGGQPSFSGAAAAARRMRAFGRTVRGGKGAS